jgi:hypothetical protein
MQRARPWAVLAAVLCLAGSRAVVAALHARSDTSFLRVPPANASCAVSTPYFPLVSPPGPVLSYHQCPLLMHPPSATQPWPFSLVFLFVDCPAIRMIEAAHREEMAAAAPFAGPLLRACIPLLPLRPVPFLRALCSPANWTNSTAVQNGSPHAFSPLLGQSTRHAAEHRRQSALEPQPPVLFQKVHSTASTAAQHDVGSTRHCLVQL